MSAGVLDVFVRLAGEPDGWSAAGARFFAWSLIHQEGESGRPAAAAGYPDVATLPPGEVERVRTQATAWLSVRDSVLWRQLAEVLAASTLSPEAQLAVIDLARLARTRMHRERTAVERYSRAWATRSREGLIAALVRIASPAAGCDYMATYRPAGFVAPPFGLAAEIVLIAFAESGVRPSTVHLPAPPPLTSRISPDEN